jgi:nicotinate-nucleotide--dimethylbenzimidazole phosphoribosyltransferase
MDGPALRNPFTDLAAHVQWPDQAAADALRRRAPLSWGQLTDHAEWIAAAQGADPPHAFRRVRLIRVGPSAAQPLPDDGLAGVADFDDGDSPDVAAAIDAGAALADREADSGTDLVLACWADDGPVPMAAIAALTNTEPVKAMPRGAVLTPDDWMTRAAAVRDLRRLAVARRDEPVDLVTALAEADGTPAATRLAAVTGLLLRCAARRTPVVLDGLGALAAAVLGHQVHAGAGAWWRAADTSPHPAADLALSRLGHRPVLDMATATGDGSAGVVAVAALRWAVFAAAAPA